MSSYWYTTKGALIFNKAYTKQFLTDIKDLFSASSWDNYGWIDEARQIESLNDVIQLFDINLVREDDNTIAFNLDVTYASACFSDLLLLITPYLEDCCMSISSEDYSTTITIKNRQRVD